jgi:hypothetical protein
MGTVDRRLLDHWHAARWRRHERPDSLDAELQRVVVDARAYVERRQAALRPAGPAHTSVSE